jgi:hypothetical protein
MKKVFVKDAFGWGFVLWLIGYLLGMVLFFIVPPALLGWTIMPFGIAITLWVILKKIKHSERQYYFNLAAIWTFLAIVLDYLFIVKLLNPKGGYYKPDVYLYYTLTLLLPLIGYWWKTRKTK